MHHIRKKIPVMKKPVIVALALTCATFFACKKDDDKVTPVTAVDLLASGAWRIDTIGFDGDKNGSIDEAVPSGFVEACDLDNTLTFNKDGATGVADEGAAKCDPADPQTIDFGYQLKNGDSVINFTGNLPDELKGDVNIITLSNTQFILSKRVVIAPIFDENLIIAFKK
jgi:hypothetical protein